MTQLLWIVNPYAILTHFGRHRYLLLRLAKQEVQVRYRGTLLGVVWPLLTPLIMLAVYTFVFSVVFQTRWGAEESQSRADFALTLFAGLTAFNLFAETVSAAPELVVANQNYVKRVVFPLEILPVSRFLANLVQAGCGFLVLLVAVLLVKASVPWTVLLLPVVLIPLSLLTIGCSFVLAFLGVFIRDVRQVVGLVVTVLLFLSAVFFPISAIPEPWQQWLRVNPLIWILEDVRRVTLQGLMPDWFGLCLVTFLSAVVAAIGLAGFMKAKNAFADVL